MCQKFVLSVAGLLVCFCAVALPASADSITLTLNQPNSALSAIPGPYGTVTATLNGSSIDAVVNMFPGFTVAGGGSAFGFNVVGSMLGLNVTNLTSGFTCCGSGQVDEHGVFMVVINGPQASQGVSTLSFTASRTDGFTSAAQIVALSLSTGQLDSDFVAHVIPASGLNTGFAGAVPVPEPASLGLLGIGMLALGLVFRRQRLRHLGSS